MPTTDPAPEWDWYSNRDLFIGTTSVHGGPFEDVADEEREEVAERDRRRLPRDQIGFQVPRKKRRRK